MGYCRGIGGRSRGSCNLTIDATAQLLDTKAYSENSVLRALIPTVECEILALASKRYIKANVTGAGLWRHKQAPVTLTQYGSCIC